MSILFGEEKNKTPAVSTSLSHDLTFTNVSVDQTKHRAPALDGSLFSHTQRLFLCHLLCFVLIRLLIVLDQSCFSFINRPSLVFSLKRLQAKQWLWLGPVQLLHIHWLPDHTYYRYYYYWDWIPGDVTGWGHLDSTFAIGFRIRLSKFWALKGFQRKGA